MVSEGVPVSATDNYTPTTEEVRLAWWALIVDDAASNAALDDVKWEPQRSMSQFDRWLAAERAKAWDAAIEAATEPYEFGLGWESSVAAIRQAKAKALREVQ